MSTPDPPLAEADALLAELRERCAAPTLGPEPEELLIDGYATALQLEGARRRLREAALELTQRELALAARERELRELLAIVRARTARNGAADTASAWPASAPPGEPRRSLR